MKYLILCLGLLQISTNAFSQISMNTDLVGQIDYPQFTNDIWGYVDDSGNDYAIVGLKTGTSIVKVEADTLIEIDMISGEDSFWRDIKTHSHYAYVTNETGSGLDIIDLSGLPQTVRFVGTYQASFTTAHNLFIADGFAYVAGSNGAQGVEILDLSNPALPVRSGGWSADYFHDVFVLGDTLYASAASRGSVMLLDISNKAQPVLMAEVVMPDGGFVHNAWTTPDGRYLMTTQENAGLTVKMWDIRDFSHPILLDEYLSQPGNLAHNTHISGDFAYISHYGDGLRIVDISDPSLLVEVGFYDTHQNDQGLFEGAWGAFPFTNSGYIYVSDEENGLFVVSFNHRRAERSKGRISDAQTGAPLAGATMTVLETSATELTDSDGNYGLGFANPGTYTIRVSAEGHQTKDVSLTLAEGQTEMLDIKLQPLTTGVAEGDLTVPQSFVLEQNYPNPFNAGTTIRYELSGQMRVLGKIFNVTGKEVRTLIDAQQPAGSYRINWDGSDNSGRIVSSGLYLLQLRAGTAMQTRKMIFVQ